MRVAISIADYEASFLRLVDKLTNGSRIEINETGTRVRLRPGFVSGGRIEHECGRTRYVLSPAWLAVNGFAGKQREWSAVRMVVLTGFVHLL